MQLSMKGLKGKTIVEPMDTIKTGKARFLPISRDRFCWKAARRRMHQCLITTFKKRALGC